MRIHFAGRLRYIHAASHLLRLPNCKGRYLGAEMTTKLDRCMQRKPRGLQEPTQCTCAQLLMPNATHSRDYTSQCWRHLSHQEIVFRYRKTKARPPAIDAPFRESE